MNRRDLLKLACGTVLCRLATRENDAPVATHARPALIDRLGVGLFTIPHLLEHDFEAAMQLLARIGFQEIELFGPYPYSVPEAHASWNAVASTIGLSQSGYYGMTARQIRSILDANGLSSPSMHSDLATLKDRTHEMAEAASVLGHRYAGIAAIPPELRQSLDDYKRTADTFNEIGLLMSEFDLKFLYHNHGYGLVELDGVIPFNLILERTDPDLVAMEMDLYWMTAGRADPVAYLDAYPGRFKLMHIKDMTEVVHFEGDGGDPSQWIALFPYMTDAGKGVLDLKTIVAHASKSGVEHFYLERDLAPQANETLEQSFHYLSAL